MKRIVLTILLALLSTSVFAADTVVKGYLIDARCAARIVQKSGSAANHGKQCLQMGPCEESGYGVLTEDNKFIKFDKDGNEKAKKFLADSSKGSDFAVNVSGAVSGDQMTVSKIEAQ